MYRQGDVMVVKVDKLPQGAKVVENRERVVLAYGEVTGHAHALDSRTVTEFATDTERFIQVDEPTPIKHEEHGAIMLDNGVYKIIRQREFAGEYSRQVAD